MTHPFPIFGFVAASGTGKTTLISRILPVLCSRGWRVGYLKHAHHSFDLDTPGKDSHRIREAGAVQTLLTSSTRWALQTENPGPVDPSLDAMLARFDPELVDIVLVEGFKHARYAKIEIYRGIGGEPPLYPEHPDVLAVATDAPLPRKPYPEILALDDAEAVADFIEARLAESGFDRKGTARVP